MAPNAYEAHRRAAKVERLVHVIDARAARAGYDPHGDPGKIAVILEKRATEERWRQYAELAGVNPPSPETQQAVIAVYRRRAEALARLRAELEAEPEQERPSRPSLRPLTVAMLNETAAALSRAGLAQETEVRNAG